ncbi:MAG: sugar transferase [Lachnospiraceae bacterium]|nr:sugar transferase [Lachnospiraceae bacterium]
MVTVTAAVIRRTKKSREFRRCRVNQKSIYVRFVKGFLDRLAALAAILLLSWLFLILTLVVLIDSPGPVIFTQKRVGKKKNGQITYFNILKFRTMKTSTPQDVPTHLLENPDQYTTRTGHFLRKTSLDELPQLFNILMGQISLVGPRPALWNQDDLVEARERYGANDVLPGLTGWAQINGRDELSIEVKARLDGEYAAHQSFLFDVKCLAGTVGAVIGAKGFREGKK